jgi:F-type H+-transporting ATPase subunit b
MIFQDPTFWVGVAFAAFIVLFGKKIFLAILGSLDQKIIEIEKSIDHVKTLAEEAQNFYNERAHAAQKVDKLIEELRERAHKELVFLKENGEELLVKRFEQKKTQVKQRIKLHEEQTWAYLRQNFADNIVEVVYRFVKTSEDKRSTLITHGLERFPKI